jgi:hypothetical protein
MLVRQCNAMAFNPALSLLLERIDSCVGLKKKKRQGCRGWRDSVRPSFVVGDIEWRPIGNRPPARVIVADALGCGKNKRAFRVDSLVLWDRTCLAFSSSPSAPRLASAKQKTRGRVSLNGITSGQASTAHTHTQPTLRRYSTRDALCDPTLIRREISNKGSIGKYP